VDVVEQDPVTHGGVHPPNRFDYRLAEQGMLRFIPEKSLPIPPAHFVRVLNALTEGLLFERPLAHTRCAHQRPNSRCTSGR
jgi:hypothetical protein